MSNGTKFTWFLLGWLSGTIMVGAWMLWLVQSQLPSFP